MFIKIIFKLEDYFNENPFTFTYGLGRTFLALSTLSIFLFNDISILYSEEALNVISNSNLLINEFNFFGIFGFSNLKFAQLISIGVFLFVISGYFPQISGILHFWVSFSFNNSALLLDGGEQIASIFTLLLLPICLLDKRINHWYKPIDQSLIAKVIGHFFFGLISLQTSYIYLNTAIEKLYRISEWKEGTAIYYVFNNPMFGVPNFVQNSLKFITSTKYVLFFTWSVILSHLILSYVLLLKRESKKKAIFAGIFLHGGIAIFMGLYSFSLAMFGVLILYLLPFNSFKNFKIYGKFK